MLRPVSRRRAIGKARPSSILTACLACCVILSMPASLSASPGDGPGHATPTMMLDLLSSTQSRGSESRLDPDTLSIDLFRPNSGSPARPLFDFLLAETYLARGDSVKAYGFYLETAAASISPPDGGGPRFGDLAAVSLLRAAHLLGSEAEFDREEAGRLIQLAGPLLSEYPTHTMLQLPVLGGHPRLMEGLLERITHLAWSAGELKTAVLAFLKYLSNASAADLDSTETEILDHVISQGIRSAGELALLRGRRFYRIADYENAARLLEDAMDAGDPYIRAEAGHYLARTMSMQGAYRLEILDLLTESLELAGETDLAQDLLFYRSEVLNRPGPGRDSKGFVRDLEQIIQRFPAGPVADDALYSLAIYYHEEGNTEAALHHLARLRNHAGPNDWLDSSYFRAALMLYSRSDQGDMEAARELLLDLLEVNPEGQLGLAAQFWLGRIAEDQGDTLSASLHFESILKICPYDYYAIRARMHLGSGAKATHEVLADSTTRAGLAGSFKSGQPKDPLGLTHEPADPMALLTEGLHAAAYKAERRMVKRLPGKQQADFTMEDLDAAGAYAAAGLLMALRQEVVREATEAPAIQDRLRIASSIGRKAGDWPLAMLLLFGLDRSIPVQSILQSEPDYPAVAYPPVYADLIAPTAATHDVSPELLYAVIRRESLFYTGAVSKRGALGLFQFMPSTFETLDDRWNVLNASGATSMELFLRDPEKTIDLGARWFKEELLKRNNGNILFAVMEHNAGYPALRAWRDSWESAGRSDDIEYMIETAGFAETRIFTRSVLTDMVMVDALGLFK